MKRFVIWTAVSTEEQARVEAPSMPAQRAALEALASQLANGQPYSIVDVLEIAGFSRYYNNWDLFSSAAAAAGHNAVLRMERHWREKDFDILLALDISRVGRREGIVVDFVSRTIDAGASIYLKNGGEINASNYGAMMLMSAYSTAQESRMRRERLTVGQEGRFQRGLQHARPPISHLIVRDANGKPTGEYVLNDLHAPIWRDMATLLLEGVPWDYIERDLYARFGHVNPQNGKPFSRLALRRLVVSTPLFWGHVARHHTRSNNKGGFAHKISPWIWDESAPLPPDAKVQRNVAPAVWTGKLAEAMKAELSRRMDIKGKARPAQTRIFSGLVICEECERRMVTIPLRSSVNDTERPLLYLRCASNMRYGDCGKKLMLPYRVLQAYIHETIVSLIDRRSETGDELGFNDDDSTSKEVAVLKKEIAQLDTRISSLVAELSMASESLKKRLRQELETLNNRQQIALDEIMVLESRYKRKLQSASDFTNALDAIDKIGVDAFWQQEPRRIHQLLHQLMGNNRIVAFGKEIKGIRAVFSR